MLGRKASLLACNISGRAPDSVAKHRREAVRIEQRRHRDRRSLRRVASRADDRVRNTEKGHDLKQLPTHSGIEALEVLPWIQQARDRRTEHAVHLSKATTRHVSTETLIRVRNTEVVNILHRLIVVCSVIKAMSTGNIDALNINLEIRISGEAFSATQPLPYRRSGPATRDAITQRVSASSAPTRSC